MSSNKNLSLLGMLLTLVLTIINYGCGGGSAAPPPPISVSPSNTSATVIAGATAQFAATVVNDSANQGVTWAVSCSAASCGSVSPKTTASGGDTTYSAPPKAPASDLEVLLTAIAAADSTKTASIAITVPAITVSVSSPNANVVINTTQQVTATVNNDPSNAGVTWTLTQNGTACSPGCGTVAPSSTASGAAATYTAPATVPNPAAATLTASSVTDTTKVASSTITVTPPPVGVSVSPSSATIGAGGTQSFTATVTGDPANQGVTWSVAIQHCLPFGGCHTSPCTTGCGTFSPASTSSGAPTTYTAPGKLAGRAFVVATSVTNTKDTGTASLTFLPISVSVSPTSPSVGLNATKTFTATVTNDATNSGVTWSLTQLGVVCSPGCGTISPTNTASGGTVSYTAPATPTVLQAVTVSATSVEDPTTSGNASVTLPSSGGAAACAGSGSESLLKGQYAFLMQGFDSQSLGVLDKQGGLAIGGSFTADGAGNVTGGEEDIVLGQGEFYSTYAAGSTYAVGADHRGCLLLTDARGNLSLFHFALGSTNASSVATTGHIVEFDYTTGTETRTAGVLRLQDATSFAASQFKGNYTYGMVGVGVYTGRVAMAGTFSSDGISTIPSNNFDIDAGGALTTNASSTGSFICCSTNGRGSLQISPFNAAPNLPINSIFFYMINSSDAFLVVFSDVWAAGGEAIGIPSGTTFTQGSLNGAAVLHGTAQSSSGPMVNISTVSSNGTGAMTVNDNVNNAGTFTTSSTALNSVVASNGRVAFTGGSAPPVIYLHGQNQGFLVGTDPNATFGILEPQAAGPFSNASLSGAYILGTENPSADTVTLESGVLTADSNGNAAGTVDQSTGLTQNQSLNFTYSIPANGMGNVGSNTTAILISGNKLVFINNTTTNPTITVVEK